MAARLGLMPWDAKRLTPAELQALWNGWHWRHSRQAELFATAIWWNALSQGAKLEELPFENVVKYMPWYDQAYQKQIDAEIAEHKREMMARG